MAESTVQVLKNVLWTIPNCTREWIESFESGEDMESKEFKIVVGDQTTKWYLELYPNGDQKDSKSYLSLNLFSNQSNENVITIFQLGVQSKAKNGNYMRDSMERSAEKLLKDECVFQKFLSHDDLFDPSRMFIVDGKLTLICEITVIVTDAEQTIEDCALNPFSDFKKMFQSNFLADIQLQMSDGKTLKAHKTILAARSPVFFAMLSKELKKAKNNKKIVPDIKTTVMTELLRYVYCNEVENMVDIDRELIQAADKYELKGLKQMCTKSIVSTLTIENVVKSIIVADKLTNSEKLFNKCLSFIVGNYEILSSTKEWKSVPQPILVKVFTRYIDQTATNICI